MKKCDCIKFCPGKTEQNRSKCFNLFKCDFRCIGCRLLHNFKGHCDIKLYGPGEEKK